MNQKYQWGAATLDFKLALVSTLIFLSVVLIAVIRPLYNLRTSAEISSTVNNIQRAAESFYGKKVSQTSCLPLIGSFAISNLIADGYIKSEDIYNREWRFSTRFQLVNNGRWSRPTQTIVTVTFPSEEMLNKHIRHLSPNRLINNKMEFIFPLSLDRQVSWQHFNVSNGCLN